MSIAERLGIRHGREILSLATPTVLTMLSHTLMWTVDAAFLGHVSSLALGAAGLGGMIAWTLYTAFNGLSRVTSTFVSQANGRGDDRAVGDYTWQGIYIALVSGALLTLAGGWSHAILRWTGNPVEIQEASYVYIRYRTLSAIGTQLVMCLTGFFNGRRDVKTPMISGIIANGLNVLLDYLLIFGFRGVPIGGALHFGFEPMGIRGAAIATSVSVFVNAGILLFFFFAPSRFRSRYRVHLPRALSLRKAWDMMRVGFPASIGDFIDMLGFTVFSALIGRAGAASLAASQITIQILSFSFMPLWGLTTAATILVGNQIGARDPDRAERYGNEAYLFCLYYTLFFACVIAVVGRGVFDVFTEDPEVLAMAGGLAIAAAVFQIFDGLRMIGLGILQGAGDTRFPMALAFVVLIVFFVPATYYMVEMRGGGVIHAWVAGCVSYFLMAGGTYYRYRDGRWRAMRIFSEESAASWGE
ncbi:MAG: MATE family efflux transporter [Candidatus Eisenbacteria bacterium]